MKFFHVKEMFLVFAILNLYMTFTSSEHSSALVDLEPLLSTKGKIAETLENYVELETKRLEKIKRFRQDYEKLHKSASKNVDNFLSHPINAYLTIKRLNTDWKFLRTLIEDSTSKTVVYDLVEEEIFPTENDLEEAANAVIRLQDVYLLNTTELVKGEVAGAGIKAVTELTASDCFELGKNAYNETNYELAVIWFQQALDRLDRDEFQIVDTAVLLDYYAYCAFLVGNIELAVKLTKDIIKINHFFPNVYEDLVFYKSELDKRNEENKDPKATQNETMVEEIKSEIDPTLYDVRIYKALCRGEKLRTPAQERKLKCRYTSNGSKYLLLQPVKEETLNLDPWIVVYHDVIRDDDIETLKLLSEPRLERAGVFNSENEEINYVKHRVSKNGWLDDDHHPRVAHISMLIEEITGLTIDTAEELQVNKYGLGGHYEGHFDFTLPEEFNVFAELGTGNRIATWLFYLSNVEAGGSTVFPDLDVEIKPIKGSAGFWFNLFKSGDVDFRTKHAACPVISGRKWVANKWFHERGQEFRRPCDLDPLK